MRLKILIIITLLNIGGYFFYKDLYLPYEHRIYVQSLLDWRPPIEIYGEDNILNKIYIDAILCTEDEYYIRLNKENNCKSALLYNKGILYDIEQLYDETIFDVYIFKITYNNESYGELALGIGGRYFMYLLKYNKLTFFSINDDIYVFASDGHQEYLTSLNPIVKVEE